ncbi:Disease resistance protein [Corchorus olitorius]|uniref:Disease resistance protein n=1 Tax=Corchorus olitorius TaxID=93759 RepID=A0A1R3FWF1_9ROSI|nr:Disease resistance protein [Corchorus olitorius]
MVVDPLTASCIGAALSTLLKLLTDTVPMLKNYLGKTDSNIERLQELQKSLLIVDKVLSDAEEKQITNHSVQKWLYDLQDLAYDAEDLLDAIATDEGRRSQRQSEAPTMEKVINNFSKPLEAVHKKLKPIVEQIDVLGLKEGTRGHGGKSFPRFPTTSLVDESEVCLRNNDKAEILDFLTSDTQIPVVIALVGLGGIGKTTLAQFLYNDDRVKNHFDLRAWAYVSEEFDVFTLTLERVLNGRKFLLVLDNVWNVSLSQWKVLRKPLQHGLPGSKIIVTTRSHNFSSTIRAVVHDLKPLTINDCLSLFNKHAFGDEDGDPTFGNMAMEIVEKCKGLPLAAETLGGLLHSKVEAEEWEKVLKSEIWDLPDDKSDILPALRLSYHHLPSQLKRCFAYCSIFPKGHKFEKLDLVRMWIAEGLVQQPNSRKTKLPENVKKLTKLEHLDIEGTPIQQMPPNFGDLKRIQLLTKFVVGNNSESSSISEVKDLCLLRGKLSLLKLQNVSQPEDAEQANLKHKNGRSVSLNITKRFYFGDKPAEGEVLLSCAFVSEDRRKNKFEQFTHKGVAGKLGTCSAILP